MIRRDHYCRRTMVSKALRGDWRGHSRKTTCYLVWSLQKVWDGVLVVSGKVCTELKIPVVINIALQCYGPEAAPQLEHSLARADTWAYICSTRSRLELICP